MRIFGLTITRDPKPLPAPPVRYCSCDSLLHLTRTAQLARDALLAWFLFNQMHGR